MRELKLKYFIELASNIGAKARSEAQAVEQSQRAMQGSIDKTGKSLGALDAAYTRFGAGSSTERQIGYMRTLGLGIDQVTTKMRGLATLAAKGIQNAPAALAGVAAGVYAAKTMLDKPMDYSMRLARISNTTFNDRDRAGRALGKAELNDTIMGAVRKGGGSRDDAAAALNELVASGSVTYEQAKALLPTLTSGSSASGASAVQLSQIAIRAKQNMNIPLADLPALLDEANAAGKSGGFELENMAKSLPQAMAAGRQSGLTGREGFRKIVAMMQASVITAGTKDEAANNVVNLLGKINSADTTKDFAKQGFDLRGELVKGRANGLDSVDTFVGLVDKIAGKDKGYAQLKTKLDNSKDDGEKRETMSSMADILQGKAIGAVVQDRQALMSLVAVMNNRKYMTDIQQSMRDDKGSLGKDFASVADETGFKAAKVGAEAENAQFMALGGKAGVLNRLLDGAADAAQEFPRLTVAATGATMALTVLAGAVSIFGLLARRAGGGLPGVAGAAGAARLAGAAPTMNSAMALNAAAAAGTAMSAGAVAAATAGGLAVVGAPILGAGYLLSEQANSRDGLRGRIADRSARIGELDAIMAGGGSPAAMARMLAEKQRLVQDRETMSDRQNAMGGGGNGVRGSGYNDPRLLTLTSPGNADQNVTAGQTAKVELGKGELAINVQVTDDRASASTRLVAPMSSVKVSAGSTNPAGVQ